MKNASRVEAEAADWIVRRDSGNWTQELENELHSWLEDATAHRIAYLRLERTWERADRLRSMKTPDAWSVARHVPFWRRTPVIRLAAGLVLVLSGALMSASYWMDSGRYRTVVGESRSMALADGSRVTLNTDTLLRAEVEKEQRTVWLDEGEAYFEVAHDARHPFVVVAGENRVTVLGTRFSVRRSGDRLSVAVVDGRVRVSAQSAMHSQNEVVIGKSEMAIVDHGAILKSAKTPSEIERQLSWRQGKLVLDQMTLADAAEEFNRYNNKKLVITDDTVAKIRIGGSFNVDNVEGFARLLSQGFGLKVKNGDKQIEIGS
ncbi:FecR family protein [Herbaspirillum chlorophenolicum]|uniref:FecR family protein n=1 Tax=Herbaspirillum chlorophenolicum TaxID=211589 RepID=UPI00067DA079|nr:FecR family protein [Herbaspirillum chlorophenolicum]